MEQDELDEILGITRCAQCGHRLEGEIECPFCAALHEPRRRGPAPKWIYITTCFLTSPLSLYAIIKTNKLSRIEKSLAFSGCLIWLWLYIFICLR